MENASSDLVRRAIAAWYRSGNTRQPASESRQQEHDGKTYVVLLAAEGDLLAVYRVRTDGVLKHLRRWPTDVEKA
jgi:hypothetical protein